MNHFFASLTIVLAACGGDPLEPGAGHSRGAGTNTLFIEGSASADPRTDNARLGTDFDTDFSVRVSINDQPVSSGMVTITSSFVHVSLIYDGGKGRWEGTAAGYDEVYQLDVISGEHDIRGVIVDGPDVHYYTAPTAGASLDSTIANPVSWSRDDTAELITFRADDIARITITDSGTYMMGPGTLKADKDQARVNTLEVIRTNHVAPGGAIGGSDFAVSVENTIEVLAQPNPLL